MIDTAVLVAGVDEAGRGPLAGPVMAAAVVLRENQCVAGVRDSKKLTPARRSELALLIRREAVGWAVATASVREIDELNILQATLLAMRRAVEQLSFNLSAVRIDGNRCPDLPPPYAAVAETLVGGDDLCPAIGAASILAKVSRDEYMLELHRRYPRYGFDRHKGYPTAAHRRALAEWGATPEHRISFRPVREAAAARAARVPAQVGGGTQ